MSDISDKDKAALYKNLFDVCLKFINDDKAAREFRNDMMYGKINMRELAKEGEELE